ncbi:carbohydrate ABC transporter permease [Demequina capsici]|uniref:Carbohydrate ABC transporter permease n=1 Tax=Demequina capsici TaxID=3075620 RepID=A0AA96FC46_9MICO|nr:MULTISPECIES: carbohydrate ABC transporter permease [unclassified Demequina]WNM24253.1 carbohydrate ABC transporter permease [Demequina sp. OYTSA14]WNM27082.1 carbohydrate ABC transporter permease [Demequina sp. PMTSA13]
MSTSTLTRPGARAAVPSKGGDRRPRYGIYFIALLLVGVIVAPIAYIIIGGFRSNAEITQDPAGFPTQWRIENYANVLGSPVFWREVGNSTIAAVATTLLVVVLGVMAAYVLARYRFKGRNALFSVFTAGLMFPMTVAITPLYILVRSLGLMNSLAGVVIPQVGFQLSMTIIILVPFLRTIPTELEEAAFMDGCSRLGFFWRMVIPLSMPGVVTVGILAFIASWNSYMLPLFILNSESSYTLPLGVQAFASQYSVDTAKVLAFTSLSMIPALVFFSLFERRIVGGLTGAVKG